MLQPKDIDWLNEEVEKETKEFNENYGNIAITFSQKARISKDEERSFNAGYRKNEKRS